VGAGVNARDASPERSKSKVGVGRTSQSGVRLEGDAANATSPGSSSEASEWHTGRAASQCASP